jgi:hypothetical protein
MGRHDAAVAVRQAAALNLPLQALQPHLSFATRPEAAPLLPVQPTGARQIRS